MDLTEKLYSDFTGVCVERSLVRPGDRVFAAFSGGPDSTALLDLLVRWKSKVGWFALTACHFNHKLRPEADEEQRHVEEICRLLRVECVVGSGAVAELANRRKLSVHAAARELRYRFLTETAGIPESEIRRIIATGHHRDDQIETVLMRLLSGAGVEGLAGIKRTEKWILPDEVTVVRPLLSFSRAGLERYCRDRGLPFVTDPSNLDVRYPRNRIRLTILPLIEREFGKGALRGVVRSAELLDMAADLIAKQTEKALEETTVERTLGEIVLDYAAFSSYLKVLRLSILQRAARLIMDAGCRASFERCLYVDQYIATGRTGTIEIGCGAHAQLFGGRIYVFRHEASGSDFEEKLIARNDAATICNFGRLETAVITEDLPDLPPPEGSQYCDLDRIGPGPYLVKPAEPGDRIAPFGMTGRRKVSDILREAGIPPHRRRYPIIWAGGLVAVVPPFRVAERFKLTPATRRVIEFRLSPERARRLQDLHTGIR